MKQSLAIIAALILLASCVEPLPIKVGACYDNACVNVSTVIPARKSGKDVSDVQPISEEEAAENYEWFRANFFDKPLTDALNAPQLEAPKPGRHD